MVSADATAGPPASRSQESGGSGQEAADAARSLFPESEVSDLRPRWRGSLRTLLPVTSATRLRLAGWCPHPPTCPSTASALTLLQSDPSHPISARPSGCRARLPPGGAPAGQGGVQLRRGASIPTLPFLLGFWLKAQLLLGPRGVGGRHPVHTLSLLAPPPSPHSSLTCMSSFSLCPPQRGLLQGRETAWDSVGTPRHAPEASAELRPMTPHQHPKARRSLGLVGLESTPHCGLCLPSPHTHRDLEAPAALCPRTSQG